MTVQDVILLISIMPMHGWGVIFIIALALLVLAVNTKTNIKINIKAKT
jgi:hypothetical protein